ncbi:hypothetical protein JL721_12065 [Aureococcus anophagefferens]|nr:hypothetical protein JL721_12065 [Aureococcus anophagefferens]
MAPARPSTRRRARATTAGGARRRCPGALPPVAAPPPPAAARRGRPTGTSGRGPTADDDDEDAGSKKPKRVEGAATPGEVDRAVTFKGATIAWAILKRKKVIENRPYRLPCGGWIAIHVGKGAFEGDYRGLVTDCRLPTEVELMRSWQATIVGAFRVRECRRPQNCGGSFWAQGPVCNVVDAVIELKEPVSAPKGKLSLWLMDDDVRDAVAAGLKDAPILTTRRAPALRAHRRAHHAGPQQAPRDGQCRARLPARRLRLRRRLAAPGRRYSSRAPPPYYAPGPTTARPGRHAPPYGGPRARRCPGPRRATLLPAASSSAAAARHPPPFDAYDPYRLARATWPGYDPRGAYDRGAAPGGHVPLGPLEASRQWLYRAGAPPL